MTKLYRTLLCALLISQVCKAQTTQTAEFDKYVQKAVTDWQAPGLAIIVVKDGAVVFKKGYGVRQLGKSDKVDTQTMFAIASTTKAMTAACAGMLVDEGKLHWEDKVTDYLPDFQLYDPFVTRELTLKDLFLHNSGVGNTDYFWGANNIPPDEIMHRLRLVQPEYSLRSSFAYQNIFYMIAGKVIEKASGMPWENFIRKRIFEPLKMTRTVPMLKYTAGMPNLATPHFKIDSTIQVVENTTADAIAPAGGVWSCVDDMGKWVTCMLDSSKTGTLRLLKPATWALMLTPQTIVPKTEFYPTMMITKPHWTTYGLGWFQQDYKGEKVDFHTGSLNGFVAINGMITDKHTGIYLLANLDHAELRHALMFKAFDTFALGGTTDWSAEFLTLYKGLRAKGEKLQKEQDAKRVLNTSPSLKLGMYAGKYTHPLYGDVSIELVNGDLKINMNNMLKATVQHWHYDTFKGWYDARENGRATVTFYMDAPTGTVSTVNIDDLVFNKVPDK